MAKHNKTASNELASPRQMKSERAVKLFARQAKKSRTFYGADKLNLFTDPSAFLEVSRLITTDKSQQNFLNRHFPTSSFLVDPTAYASGSAPHKTPEMACVAD
jgi:hypothetical protein